MNTNIFKAVKMQDANEKFKALRLQDTAKKIAIDISYNLSFLYNEAIREGFINSYNLEIFPNGEYGYEIIVYPEYQSNNKKLDFFRYNLIVFIYTDGGLDDFRVWKDSNIVNISIHMYSKPIKTVRKEFNELFEIGLKEINEAIASLIYE